MELDEISPNAKYFRREKVFDVDVADGGGHKFVACSIGNINNLSEWTVLTDARVLVFV